MATNFDSIGIISDITVNMGRNELNMESANQPSNSGFNSFLAANARKHITHLLTLYRQKMAEIKIGGIFLNLLGITLSGFTFFLKTPNYELFEIIKGIALLGLSGCYLGFKCYQIYQQARKERIDNDEREFEFKCRINRYNKQIKDNVYHEEADQSAY